MIWTEEAFKRIPIPYQFTSAIIGLIIFSIYYFFSFHVLFFPWDFYSQLEIIALSALISLELAGVRYFSIRLQEIIYDLTNLQVISIRMRELIHSRFADRYHYLLLIIFTFIPFILIEILRISKGDSPFFYSIEKTPWSIMLDIFNHVADYFMLFMLGTILWILFNMMRILYDFQKMSPQNLEGINIFRIDRDLRSIREFILKFVVFYFLCITLAIISYVSPFGFVRYQTVILSTLLLIGVIFFIEGSEYINNYLNKIIENELNKIDKINIDLHKELINLNVLEDFSNKREHLDFISSIFDKLDKEKERVVKRKEKKSNLATIGVFITSFLLPLITMIEKLYNPLLIEIAQNSSEYFSQLPSLFQNIFK